MAATNKPDQSLVCLSLGYWGKYILPVDAATQILAMLVKSRAVKVDTSNLCGFTVYHPTKNDVSVTSMEYPFLADCPIDDNVRKEYFNWLKLKRELVGEGYVIESYAAYLDTKEET